MAATMTAVWQAAITSFVALPVISPLTICAIRFLRLLTSLRPKASLNKWAPSANEIKTTVRGSSWSLSVNIAARNRSTIFYSATGLISG